MFNENARLFESRGKFCFISDRIGHDFVIGCFGNRYKYIHELSVEDVLKPEVRHRPDMQEEKQRIDKLIC